MIVTEFKNAISTVRIHDEYCESSAERCISHLSRIISDSYKRRQLLSKADEISSEVAAANIAANIQKL